MQRRDVLKLAMTAAVACAADGWRDGIAAAVSKPAPIIDCHIHMFDTARPGGVPWPEKSDTAIYKPALPDRYALIARPLGVVGAIAVEASPLKSDNAWVLQQAADHPIIVGFVGDLIPGTATYSSDLDRLHANPVFVGIRYGNLWQRNLSVDIKKAGFLADLEKLSKHGLELDSANPDSRLIRAILDVSDHISDLRIVIDHLPGAPVPTEISARKEYWANLKRLSQNPKIFIKLSEIPVRKNNVVRKDVAFYREKLDAIWDIFGEDHILYGSDWPNGDHLATYAETLRLVQHYVSQKGRDASRKFFWKNSLAAYQWQPRQADQNLL
jgi:L-fuconolactonase